MSAEAGAPRPRVRWQRLFITLLFLGAAAGGLYVASWLNARRYFLIIDATDARVARGRMLPAGHEPFVPAEPELARAYAPIPLPGGLKVPRGETVFTERTELDQALFRLLKDAATFALEVESPRSAELLPQYLAQAKLVPGTSVSQQLELVALEREVMYLQASRRAEDAIAMLTESARLFRESTRGAGSKHGDGAQRAQLIERALAALKAAPPPPAVPPIPTASTASTSRGAAQK